MLRYILLVINPILLHIIIQDDDSHKVPSGKWVGAERELSFAGRAPANGDDRFSPAGSPGSETSDERGETFSGFSLSPFRFVYQKVTKTFLPSISGLLEFLSLCKSRAHGVLLVKPLLRLYHLLVMGLRSSNTVLPTYYIDSSPWPMMAFCRRMSLADPRVRKKMARNHVLAHRPKR